MTARISLRLPSISLRSALFSPLHYYANFSDPSSPYFQQHLRDDNQFFSDLSSGSLPAFSMVTMNEVYDGAVSDSDIGMMDSALIAHMNAIFASPGWKAGTTMVLIPFIDHGQSRERAADSSHPAQPPPGKLSPRTPLCPVCCL